MMATTIFWILFSASAGVAAGLMARSFLVQRAAARPSPHPPPAQRTASNASQARPDGRTQLNAGPPVALLTALDPMEGSPWLLRRGGTMTIGRIDDCDIVVPQQRVSRLHAQLNHRADVPYVHEFSLFDYSSTNGTRVNGRSIETVATLQDGDEIEIGSQTFRFQRIQR